MKRIKYPDGKRVYLVYDARAASGDTEEAIVMECLNATEPEAAKREALKTWRGTPFVIFGATFKNNVAVEDDAPLMKHKC